ncbi:MAG: chemotaxis protein CheD [Promethearchaeota archaeon]|jgi:chemotaxis protein CheD
MVNNIEPIDQVKDMGKDGTIFVPIGHYALFSNKYQQVNHSPKFSIYGLGSCIALILFDNTNKLSAMSHILLPKVFSDKKIIYPHKFATLSAKLLLEELIKHGATREDIKAILVGGSKIFELENNFMGTDNISSVKIELDSLKIQIVREDTGGIRGRNVIFDTKNFSLYVGTTGDSDFERIY